MATKDSNDKKILWWIILLFVSITGYLTTMGISSTLDNIDKNANDIKQLNERVSSKLIRIDSMLTVKSLIDSLQTDQIFQKLEDIEGKLP